MLYWTWFLFTFSFPNFDWSKNTIILGVDNISSVHIDNKEKYLLVLDEGQSQELDNTTITVQAKHSINFTRSRKFFLLELVL